MKKNDIVWCTHHNEIALILDDEQGPAKQMRCELSSGQVQSIPVCYLQPLGKIKEHEYESGHLENRLYQSDHGSYIVLSDTDMAFIALCEWKGEEEPGGYWGVKDGQPFHSFDFEEAIGE